MLALLSGCPAPPPPSQLPSAQAALDRMKATAACGNGVNASAKIDYFGERGRIRADLSFLAFKPARLNMSIFTMNQRVATLATDGKRFTMDDQREKRFLIGAATPCNIARMTQVPIPGHALVSLLRGQAPILKHDPNAGTISWSGKGYYVITIPSTRDATEEIHLEPHPDDVNRPWTEQRMRVRDVSIRQYGDLLYEAKLDDHRPTPMAGERIDPEGIDPPIPPSGPMCTAELPRKIKVEVPSQDQEVIFTYESAKWNEPLVEGVFTLQPTPGVPIVPVRCDD